MRQEITFLLNITENIIGISEIPLTQNLMSVFIPKMCILENNLKKFSVLNTYTETKIRRKSYMRLEN